jgi:sulfite exporter TauE/SafE
VLTFFTAIATGGLAGLVSIPHCVAMCGPYAAFACTARRRSSGTTAPFLAGRGVGYVFLGAIVGGSGGLAVGWLPPALGHVRARGHPRARHALSRVAARALAAA